MVPRSGVSSGNNPELAHRFHAEQGEAFSQLLKAIARLEQDGRIGKNKRDQYQTIERLNLIRGVIDVKSQGYGFVTPEGQEKGALDLYVSKENTLDAMNKDLVLARITRRSSPTKIEGVVVRILKRDLTFIVGEYYQGAIFPRKTMGDMLFKVPAKYRTGLVEHTLVKAEIIEISPLENSRLQSRRNPRIGG
ncbi:MAG: hypothetical protein MZU97_19535 [Bacillus subtilis]|nr:hypothetical protein [Bacillus subtilis]